MTNLLSRLYRLKIRYIFEISIIITLGKQMSGWWPGNKDTSKQSFKSQQKLIQDTNYVN